MSRIASKWIAALPPAALLGSWLAACSSLAPHGAEADQRAIIDFNTCAKPEYPRAELQARHEGTVQMKFLVTTDGAVADSQLEHTSGFPALDHAALTSLSHCRFRPARQDGRPVQAWTDIRYVWVTS